jgi:hypothetical protein
MMIFVLEDLKTMMMFQLRKPFVNEESVTRTQMTTPINFIALLDDDTDAQTILPFFVNPGGCIGRAHSRIMLEGLPQQQQTQDNPVWYKKYLEVWITVIFVVKKEVFL